MTSCHSVYALYVEAARRGLELTVIPRGAKRTRNLEIPGLVLRAPSRNDETTGMETMTKLSDATRDKLKTVSTATVATALFKRGFRIQMHPGRASARPRSADAGRRGLHAALHAGARGPQQARGVSRPRPSAAQGDRGLPARRGAGDGQPQGRPRGIRRRHPGDAADAARRAPASSPTAAFAIPPKSPSSAFPPITTARARRPI